MSPSRGRRARPRTAGRQVTGKVRSLLSPLAGRDFRLLWLGQLASTVGDWATRLALAVVVLERTGSATITSLVVGCSLVAWLGPGQILSQLADAYGRKVVMIASDVVRAVVFMLLAAPVPTWCLLLGAALAGLATPPFAAARSAAIRELTPAKDYGPAMALVAMTADAGTVLGYAFGGLLLAVASPQGALLLNAATFLLSALLIAPLPESKVEAEETEGSRLRAGLSLVFRQPVVRLAVGVTVLAAASGVGIESLVVVFSARDLGGPAWLPGALLACIAASSLVVTAALPNQGVRSRLMRAAAITSLLGAVVSAAAFLTDSRAGTVVGIVAAGAFFAVIAPANVVVGPLLSPAVRASAFSVLMGVLVVFQSLGASGAGVLADGMETRYAAALVCLPGAVGGIWVLWHRRAPDGWDEDIEGPLDVDLAMRLAAVAPRSLLGVDEEGVAPAADRPDPRPQGRHAAPEASDEPEYSQQS